MFKYAKKLLILVIAVSLFLVGQSVIVNTAQAQKADLWGDQIVGEGFGAEKLGEIGLGKNDPRVITINLIRIALGLLGVLVVILIMYGGYAWMTADGDPAKVERAKMILRNATIGLLIILSAFALATYILSRLGYSTGAKLADSSCLTGEINQCNPGDCYKTCAEGSWGPCLGADCKGDIDIDPDGSEYGDPCGQGDETNMAECNVNFDCGTYLSCDFNSFEAGCFCQGPPVIFDINPAGGFCQEAVDTFCSKNSDCPTGDCNKTTPNGAAGNLITIHGKNFLEYDSATSKVFFLDSNGSKIPVQLANEVNTQCNESWTNTQIIVIVPIFNKTASIIVESANGSDATNLSPGPDIEDFLLNNIDRPGLCKLDPKQGQLDTSLKYYGLNLLNSVAYFGNLKNKLKAKNSLFVGDILGTADVPNIKNGLTTVFVQKTNKLASNFLYFRKETEPKLGPFISSIDPASGAKGAYLTISGGGFGSLRGSSTVSFGDNESADFEFPEICANSIWQNNQIIVKVPDNLANNVPYDVVVNVKNDTAVSPNKFTFDKNAVLEPGLCKIDPSFGDLNETINLWGEYFGKQDNDSKIRFHLNQDQTGSDIVFWGKEKVPFGANPDKIITTIPEQATTGLVKVLKGSSTGKNGMNLTIGQCQQDEDCGTGVCCVEGTPEEGRCKSSEEKCYGNIDSSVFEWQFNTDSGVRCSPEQPVQCEDTSCCSSEENCQYDDKKDMTTCSDNNACTGYAVSLCYDSVYCPNSPGSCSANTALVVYGESCACSVGYYDPELNRCVSDTASCSVDMPALDISGIATRQYCALYQGLPKWHLETNRTCPTDRPAPYDNVVKLPSGDCVFPDTSCEVCGNDLECFDQDGTGVCIESSPTCPSNFDCVDDICTKDAGVCECCCDKEENEVDQTNAACCAPLTCDNDCGSSAVDLTDDDNKWGLCSGCADLGTTQAERDAACNCVSTTGKFCDTSIPGGVCRDCGQIGNAEECSTYSTCCVDAGKGDACTSITGGVVEENGITYCGYYSCDDGCSVLNKDGDYSLLKDCDPTACPGSDSYAVCGNNELEGDEECDDGNKNNGDGCSQSCIIENPFACESDNVCLDDSDCLNSEEYGCGLETCCLQRPRVISSFPEPDEADVCRNSLIGVKFTQEMNPGSLKGNVLVVGDYENELCPEDTVLLTRLARANSSGFVMKVINKFKEFLAKFFPGLSTKEASALAGNFCVFQGRTSSYNILEGDLTKTVLNFTVDHIFDSNKTYYVIVKGDQDLNSENGVLNIQNIGLNGESVGAVSVGNFNGIYYPRAHIWKFEVGNEICQVDQAKIEPAQHLFQKPQTDYTFKAFALAENGNKLFSAPGVYSWKWDWFSDNAGIAEVKVNANDDSLAVVTSGNYEDAQTWLNARAIITEDKLSPLSTVGREVTGKSRIILFMCANPWPTVVDPNLWPIRWEDSDNNCDPLGGGCLNNNFEIYYCRDRGKEATIDDLPALIEEPVVRGIFEYDAPNGLVTVLKDLMFFREDKPFAEKNWTVKNDDSAIKGGQVVVDLSKATAGFKYKIYYGKTSEKYDDSVLVDFEVDNNNKINSLSEQIINGLDNGTTYYFAITAIDIKNLESPYSAEQQVEVADVFAPASPKNVSVIADISDDTNKRIEIKWDLETNDVAKYYIEYGPYDSPAVKLNVGLKSNYSIIDLDNLAIQNYYVRIIAVDSNDNKSNPVELSCNKDCFSDTVKRCDCL